MSAGLDESNSELRTCKKCGQTKRRYLAGTYPNGRDKRWMAEDGALWSGAICSICQRNKMKEHMAKKRAGCA